TEAARGGPPGPAGRPAAAVFLQRYLGSRTDFPQEAPRDRGLPPAYNAARAPVNDARDSHLEDDVELTLEQRTRISNVHAALAETDLYALLGVARDADKKVIKRAFYDRAAEFHTDRFFRKRLGAFKSKMEVIFAKVTEAYETLRVKESRARY